MSGLHLSAHVRSVRPPHPDCLQTAVRGPTDVAPFHWLTLLHSCRRLPPLTLRPVLQTATRAQELLTGLLCFQTPAHPSLPLTWPACTPMQAATRAQELLTGLRRGGPRDFLVAVRGPGDFIGEMEVLGERQAHCGWRFGVKITILGFAGRPAACMRAEAGASRSSSVRQRRGRPSPPSSVLEMKCEWTVNDLRIPCEFHCVTPRAGGSQSRRVATVVAASPIVRAAIIPYPAAKAYLARHPLVSLSTAAE